MKTILKLSCLCLILYCSNVFSWTREIAVGAGYGKEVEQNYDNYGLVISGKIYKFNKIDDTLYATLDVFLADVHSTTRSNNHFISAAIAPAFRAYFFNPCCAAWMKPYLGVSLGPCYMSERKLGTRTQGSKLALQTTLEAGIERGCIDLNLRLMHYCNAGLAIPNQAINLVPVFSIGYMF